MFGKLEKLTIRAFPNRRRSPLDETGHFEAMFNPESWSQRFAISYGKDQGYNSSGKPVNYLRTKPSELKLKLVLDGTGASQYGFERLASSPSVGERVDKLLDLAYRMNGDIHEPTYLLVEWGDLTYSCRLGAIDVTYTSFDRSGKALRAELECTFIGDKAVSKRMAQENKRSPDLTHVRTVVAGDTLPLLAKSIYGSSAHYLFVAEANGLDDFRDLRPGQRLVFPPLDRARETGS